MKTLQAKILIFFSVLIVLAGAILSFVIFHSSSQLIENSVGTQAMNIALNVSHSINVEDFQKVAEQSRKVKELGGPQSVLQMPEYVRIREELAELKKMNGLKYLYTMAEASPGVNMYVVDGYPMDNKEDASMPGAIEQNYYPSMDAAFKTAQTQIGSMNNDNYGASISTYVPIVDQSGKMVGIVGADFDATNIYQLNQKQRVQMMLITGGILLLTILVSYIFAKFLVKPLRSLTQTVAQVQQGDLTVHFEKGGKDEIAQLGLAFEEMVNDLNTMIKGINHNSYSLTQSSNELAASSETASDSTKQFVDQIQSLKEDADKQLRISEKASKTFNQMSVEIRHIADSALDVNHMSSSVASLADQGKNQVAEATSQIYAIQETQKESSELMRHLGERSAHIIEIVDVISGIAKQTNMLALNASIEAARAGEAGRGFAVVAEEVQKLAVESAGAASRINELVQDIQIATKQATVQMEHSTEQINQGAAVIDHTGQSFLSIIDAVHEVTVKIEAVTNTTQMLASSSNQMVESFKEVEETAMHTSQATEECSQFVKHELAVVEAIEASAEELTAMSIQLHELIKKFKVSE
ncbi:methyl-accepting chemotaxis protein [Brevibacillus ginsengisoli]|uniref:methyl-accepting chemotaxis protein n=1 Tax=Brevibacillus ginsengisoli TaxID=363854 RepID=UPI003CF845F6